MGTRSEQASLPPHSLWSELDSSTVKGSSLPPSSSEPPFSWVWEPVIQWLAFLRGLTLAAGSAASAAVAGAGLVLLLLLATTITLAPANDTFSRSLEFDFSQGDLVADAVFLPEAQIKDGLLPAQQQPDARFLAPLQPVDVWVELQVPRSCGQGVAQVVAQLTSVDGRVAGKASKAVMLCSSGWSLSSLSLAPLRLLGLSGNTRRVRVPLFSGYRDKREVPFMVAHIAVKTRNPTWSAEVLSACVKVQLRLGFLRRILYTLRPGTLGILMLGSTGLAAACGGGLAAAVFLGLLLYAGIGGRGGTAVEDAGSVSGGEDVDVDVEVSSVSGISEASSTLERQVLEEGEPPSPRLHPGMHTAPPYPRVMPAAAAAGLAGEEEVEVEEEEELWQEAGAGYVRGGKHSRPTRKAGPADSAMGSEASGGGTPALRRRPGATAGGTRLSL